MAAPLLSRKTAIKIKVESTKGTEISGDTDILVSDIEMNPESDYTRRNGAGLYLGNNVAGVVDGRIGKCTFTMELMAYTGHALNPGLAILLQACGMAQATQVYTIHSTFTNQVCISIDYFQDGLEKTLFGAMGNVTFEGEAGKRILCKFEFTGLYKAIADTALPSFAPATQKPMLMQSGAFTMNSAAKNISRFSLNLGNVVSMRADPSKAGGLISAIITDYDPELSVDPEADNVATYAFEALWQAGTEHAISLAVSDGIDKATFTLPKVQAKSLPHTDRDGILVHDWKGQCNHSSGNDAVSMAVATV